MHGATLVSAPATVSVARLGARRVGLAPRLARAAARSSRSSRRVGVVLASFQEPETDATETAPASLPDLWSEDDLDSIQFAADPDVAAIGNKAGAGATMDAPDWLTQLNRLWGGNS